MFLHNEQGEKVLSYIADRFNLIIQMANTVNIFVTWTLQIRDAIQFQNDFHPALRMKDIFPSCYFFKDTGSVLGDSQGCKWITKPTLCQTSCIQTNPSNSWSRAWEHWNSWSLLVGFEFHWHVCCKPHASQIFPVLDHEMVPLPYTLLKAIVILFLSFHAFGVEYSSCLCSVYTLIQLMVGLAMKRGGSASLKPTPSALDMYKKLRNVLEEKQVSNDVLSSTSSGEPEDSGS